ncbi:MAG: rhomboid family intramembrane serine protease, partial [Verrucomicrobiales bacterium]|nr:rhomboid family intramembrane serine protease [Verrucomicrobiales bacterium]
YMRDGDGYLRRSPVVILLVLLGFLFFVECFLQVYANTSLGKWLGLSAATVRRGEYWRLFTYQFLHTAPWPWHILFNGIGLWFFGRSVLEAVGVGRFWKIYLLAGLLGGVVDLMAQVFHPRYMMEGQWTVGASASILGLAGAFCFLFPTRETVFFLYVIPVKLRSMTMFWVLFGFSVFGTVFPHGGIAHAAHLGGLLTGAAFVRLFLSDDAPHWWQRLSRRRGRDQEVEEEVAVPLGASGSRPGKSAAAAEPETPEEFMRREVDPILDKISAHGIQSLTEKEKRILEKARERMRNR